MLTATVPPGLALPAAPRRRDQPRCRTPRSVAPSAGGEPIGSASREELVAAIRGWEGEAVEHPPLLFQAVVAVGSAMLSGAGLLVLGLAV